eukprot:361250-Chlamydomonas_euryale.AAC.3
MYAGRAAGTAWQRGGGGWQKGGRQGDLKPASATTGCAAWRTTKLPQQLSGDETQRDACASFGGAPRLARIDAQIVLGWGQRRTCHCRCSWLVNCQPATAAHAKRDWFSLERGG